MVVRHFNGIIDRVYHGSSLSLCDNIVACLPFRTITHNIRYAAEDLLPGEFSWSKRRDLIVAELVYQVRHCDALIALQEVLHHQLMDILRGLNESEDLLGHKRWDYIGVGRDDGNNEGEFVPLLYQPAIWEVEQSKNLWLSRTPEQPSKDWGSGSKRILTVAWLRHRQGGKRLLALNTHLDNASEEARFESATLILDWVKIWLSDPKSSKGLPVFLAGDFNSSIAGTAYKILIGEGSPLSDVCEYTPLQKRYGHSATYTGFKNDNSQRIDFILVGPKVRSYWQIEGYAVLESRFDDGIFNSDHRAVVADLTLL